MQRTEKSGHVSDKIREELKNAGIILKDQKDGADWEVE